MCVCVCGCMFVIDLGKAYELQKNVEAIILVWSEEKHAFLILMGIAITIQMKERGKKIYRYYTRQWKGISKRENCVWDD